MALVEQMGFDCQHKKGKAGEESVNIRFSAKTGVASRAIPPYETVDSREFWSICIMLSTTTSCTRKAIFLR